jgi:hypothetical protein
MTWDRLINRWDGPQRIWLFAEDGSEQRLQAAGLTVHRIDAARSNLLLSNQPDPP